MDPRGRRWDAMEEEKEEQRIIALHMRATCNSDNAAAAS